MKETLHRAGILAPPKKFLYVVLRTNFFFFRCSYILLSYCCSLSINSSKMHSRSATMGIFCPTGMSHRVGQQPTV